MVISTATSTTLTMETQKVIYITLYSVANVSDSWCFGENSVGAQKNMHLSDTVYTLWQSLLVLKFHVHKLENFPFYWLKKKAGCILHENCFKNQAITTMIMKLL